MPYLPHLCAILESFVFHVRRLAYIVGGFTSSSRSGMRVWIAAYEYEPGKVGFRCAVMSGHYFGDLAGQ